jgi:hypothetical protein
VLILAIVVRRRSFMLVTLQAAAFVLAGLGGLGVRAAVAAPADDRAARVARLEAQRGKLDEERRALEKQLSGKTQEVAALKKQRASWSRDQKLDKRLREAKDLAGALDRKAAQIRGVDAQLKGERAALVKDIDAELAAAPAAARQAQLARWRADTQRKLGGPRRVEVADEDMSPLDDPEDLEEKAGTLADSEKRLRTEEQRLERRVAYYHKQAKLQRAKQREKEQDVFDDEPRRGGGGSTTARGPGASAQDEQGGVSSPATSGDSGGLDAPPPADPGAGAGGGESDLGDDPAVVYADVVDPATLAELERAERSGDPENKAKAADRALKDVRARADRLRAKRLEMEKRARKLREQGD